MKQDMRVDLEWQEWIIDLRKNVLLTGTLNWGNKGKTVWRKMRNMLIMQTVMLLFLKEKVKNEI